MDPDQWSAYALLEQGIEEGQRLQQIRIAQSLNDREVQRILLLKSLDSRSLKSLR